MSVKGTDDTDFDALQEKILQEVPAVRQVWDETASKRNIAQMLTHIRTERGLAQKDVASRAGWDKAYVSRLEGARGGVPDAETIARYVNACDAVVGLVVGTATDSSHIHVVDAITLPSMAGGGGIEFERLRETDIDLAENE